MNKFGASTDIGLIKPEIDKIDSATTDGLLGVNNSLSYRVAEIERHLHNVENWFGAALSPVGETHIADDMAIADDPFVLTAGNNAFGSWLQVLGSDDTPVIAGAVKFDAHRVMVVDTNSVNPFVIQIVSGEFADIPTKLAAREYSTTPYKSPSNLNDSGIEDTMVRRTSVGEKVWARIRCIGSNGSTLSFFYGIHEYEG